MTQLVPIVLDLILSPEEVAGEVARWMDREGAGPRDEDERGKIKIAAIKACLLVMDRAREIGHDMDAEEATP